tara:strand:- start:116 stop:310 length:195 start_codon:yes stop_codon:yes gene_type:complete
LKRSYFWKQNPELEILIDNEFFRKTALSDFLQAENILIIRDFADMERKEIFLFVVNAIQGTVKQ